MIFSHTLTQDRYLANGDSIPKKTVLINLLRFQVRLTRFHDPADRTLNSKLNTGGGYESKSWFQRLPSSKSNALFSSSQKITADNHDRELTFADVNVDELEHQLSSYMADYFNEALKNEYAPVSQIILYDGNRKLLSWDNEEEDGHASESDDLLNKMLFGAKSKSELAQYNSLRGSSQQQDRSLESTQDSLTLFSTTFEGIAVFTTEAGGLPVPNENTAHSIQVKAFASTGAFENQLKTTNLEDGLTEVVSTVIKVVSVLPSIAPSSSSGNNSGISNIIVIAIVIAALSLFLLFISVYLACRRRRYYYGRGFGRSRNSPHANSKEKHEMDGKADDCPETKDSSSGRLSGDTPPVINVNHQADDVSAYTESIISGWGTSVVSSKSSIKSAVKSDNKWQPPTLSQTPTRESRVSDHFKPRFHNDPKKPSVNDNPPKHKVKPENDLDLTPTRATNLASQPLKVTSPIQITPLKTVINERQISDVESSEDGLLHLSSDGSSAIASLCSFQQQENSVSAKYLEPQTTTDLDEMDKIGLKLSQSYSKSIKSHYSKNSPNLKEMKSGSFSVKSYDNEIASSVNKMNDTGTDNSIETYGYSLDGVGDQSPFTKNSRRSQFR